MIRAALVTHGPLGEAMRLTAERIVGRIESLDVLSNAEHSAESLLALLRDRTGAHADGGADAGAGGDAGAAPDEPLFLFADLYGGGPCFACEALRRERPATWVFTGVNLPMLIDFLHNRDRMAAPELAERLLKKGREGIQCH